MCGYENVHASAFGSQLIPGALIPELPARVPGTGSGLGLEGTVQAINPIDFRLLLYFP